MGNGVREADVLPRRSRTPIGFDQSLLAIPFMLANIDREVVGVPGVQVLECKTAGEFGSRLWKDGVPEYVQLQVQHQLAVTGKAAADVAVLLCGQ